MPPLILAIDIGTSSVRALLFDQQAQALPGMFAQQATPLHTAADGTAIVDADALLAGVAQCIDQVLALAGQRTGAIAAVAVATLASSFLVLDAEDTPSPLILYADSRNSQDADHLRREFDEAFWHQRTGCMLRSPYWPARIRWLQRTQPDVWQQAARLLTIGEYLEQRWFGRSRVSVSAASWGGLLNRHSLAWDNELLAALGLRHGQLSTLVDVDTPLHGLGPALRERWPALADVPWFPAIGDGAAANIGSGCVDGQTMALTVGTTGALRVARPAVATIPHGLWCYRIDQQQALLGGATSEGGNLVAWLRQVLRFEWNQHADQALATLEPDSHGLTVLPLLAGERSPGWAGHATATIHGLTTATTPIQIARAGLEAVACRFALIAAMLREEADDFTLIASGGALLASPTWAQICADALGLPITLSAEPEATARGAALLALRSLGIIADLKALPATAGQTFHPNHQHHARYQAVIERQQRLYRLLVGET